MTDSTDLADTYERYNALRESHEIAAQDAFFATHPEGDNETARKLFREAFVRGFNQGDSLSTPANLPASTPATPLSVDQIDDLASSIGVYESTHGEWRFTNEAMIRFAQLLAAASTPVQDEIHLAWRGALKACGVSEADRDAISEVVISMVVARQQESAQPAAASTAGTGSDK